jgi:hypothetical protein
MDNQDRLVVGAGRAALAGGVLGIGSLVAVLVGETTQGMTGFMGSPVATLAGWGSFAASALLVVGLVGVAVRYADRLSGVGRAAMLLLGFATAVMVGVNATLALVVPTLAAVAPELAGDPPVVVPATFILSGLVMGVCALVLAGSLRRSGAVTTSVFGLLVAGAILTMVPLPSRFFLLAFAVGALALVSAAPRGRVAGHVTRAAALGA